MEEKKRRYTEAQNKATQKYHAAHMEQIQFRVNKVERLDERITRAASLRHVSKAAYIHDAICASLDADGVTIDSLPDDQT